ncbi:MAG: stage III sporulation protein AE [Methylocystaceae bacterium]
MKWLQLCFMILICWGLFTPAALAAEQVSPDAMAEQLLNKMDLKVYEDYKQQIEKDMQGELIPASPLEWIRDFMKGESRFDFKKIAGLLLGYLVREVTASSALMAKLMVLAVVSALLVNLQTSFASENVAKIASLACFLALAAIALGSFKAMLQLGLSTVTSLADFMTAALPQLAIVMTGMGNINSATMLFPILVIACSYFSHLIEAIIFPLITLSAILHLVNNVSDTVKVSNLASLIKNAALFILGLVMTMFVGVLTMRAVYSKVLDGLALRTTTMVVDNFPVIGGFLSDALNVALGYLVLLKQAVGVLGIIMVLGICILPIIKMLAVVLVYKLTAAMVEPMGDQRTSDVLAVIGDHLSLLTGVVGAVALMFIIMVSIVAGVSNHVLMLR